MSMVTLPAPQPEAVSSRMVRDLIERQPLLAWTALVMLVLAVPVALATQIDPRLFNGVSVWTKPFKFLFSVGVYLAMLAWFFGLLRDEARRSRGALALVWVAIVAGVFEVAYITLQGARGEASHFNTDTPFAAAMYSLMGVGAVALTACSPWLAVLLARRGRPDIPPVYRLAVLIGLGLTFILGATVGGYMGSQPGHWVGGTASDAAGLPLFGWSRDGGDLRVAHFLGIHALQILPLAGWWMRGHAWGRALVVALATLLSAATIGTLAQAILAQPLL